MVKSVLHDYLRFNLPANYCISVKGFLDDSWSDRLSGFRISNQGSDREVPVAMLSGRIQDQTELIGVLNGLYEMHLPILSVELLDDDELNDK
jgi:hypothetical protein